MKQRLIAVSIFLALLLGTSPLYAQSTTVKTLNDSVVITTGNTFQTVLVAATAPVQRKSLTVQNNNTSDSCWITFGSISGTTITAANATKATSILLLAGGAYTRYSPYIPSDEIEATCASSSDTLYVDVQ